MRARPLILVLLVFFVGGFFLLRSRTPLRIASEASVDAELERFIWWLPPDTETLEVARGPFRIGPFASPITPGEGLERILQWETVSLLLPVENGPAASLSGRTVIVAIQGSRKFRAPRGLGLMPYEGCQIILFAGDIGTTSRAIEKEIAGRAKKKMKIEGHEVFVYEETWEDDDWTVYVAMPAPRIFLAATHEGYLKEVLQRIKKRADARALPEELPEWKLVNKNASFWAIRHFSKSEAQTDPTSPFGGRKIANTPDEDAIGLVMSYSANDGKTARAFYLSNHPDLLEIAKGGWPTEQGLSPTVHLLEPGVAEIRAKLEIDTTGLFLFFLEVYLGHAVFV